jgi:hypothetical protein
VREELAQRDRARVRRQAGHELGDRLVVAQPPVGLQEHHGGGRELLGERGERKLLSGRTALRASTSASP